MTGGTRNSRTVSEVMGREATSSSSAAMCSAISSANSGSLKYQFSTGRSSGTLPVSVLFGAISSAGGY